MGKNPSTFKAPESPADGISWDEAGEFCKMLSQKARKTVRLPTEAEWEYACRAGTKTAYSFGNDAGKLGDYAWFDRNSDKKTHAVGQKKPNPWGLYDMHGNVWEWCSDWYADSYLPAGQAGAKGKTVDPHGPDSGKERVQRGGAWTHNPKGCRSANRDRNDPTRRAQDMGFRVVVGAVGGD
jgi:formylglycine-generating enzyme required for sulfatase activity